MRRSEDMPVALGALLDGKYRLERVIGRGGMGVVYAATQLALERQVAIKVMRPSLSADKEAVARFDREARATCTLMSRHVAKMFDVGRSEDGDPYFVMELLTGTTLQALLKKSGPLAPEQVVAIALDIVDGLSEAHAAGIIHRDLKPANVFLGTTVKVLDFGIAKVEGAPGEGITTTGAMLGTPEFMAPEQLDTKRGVSTKSDVWSLGVTMYNALTGKTPFEAESFYELSIKVYAHEPTPVTKHRADLPPDLVAIIGACLQKDAKKRITLEEVAKRLAPLKREEIVIASLPATTAPGGIDAIPAGPTAAATPVEVSAVAAVDAAPAMLELPPHAPPPVAPPVASPPPAVLEARRSPTLPPRLVAIAGATALILAVTFLLVRRRSPAPGPEPEPVAAAASTELEDVSAIDEPGEPGPRVVAATPLPPGSTNRAPAPNRNPTRRRHFPAAPPATAKASNGALTHER